MDTVQSILERFSNCEKELLYNIATSRNSNHSKKLRLFELYLNNPENPDSFYSQKIYGNEETSAFAQLKKRLKEEIEEVMVLIKPTKTNFKQSQRILCTELLLKGQLVLIRGLSAEGSKLLEKCLKLSVENQFYDIVLTIFSIAQEYGLSEVLSSKDLPHIEKVITDHLDILIQQINEQPSQDQKPEKHEIISKLLSQVQCHKDQWALLGELQKTIEEKDLTKGMQLIQGKKSLLLLKEKDSQACWQLLVYKIKLLILREEYQQAAFICREQSTRIDTNAPIEYHKLHFLSLYYHQQWEEAIQLIHEKLLQLFPDEKYVWTYYEALTRLRMKQFKISIKLFHSCIAGLKNTPEYYLGAKLYEIIALLEQQDQDWVEFKIENFRKLLGRWRYKSNQRIKVAFEAIVSIYSCSRDKYTDCVQNETKKLSALRESHDWCPFGYELLRLDKWISEGH